MSSLFPDKIWSISNHYDCNPLCVGDNICNLSAEKFCAEVCVLSFKSDCHKLEMTRKRWCFIDWRVSWVIRRGRHIERKLYNRPHSDYLNSNRRWHGQVGLLGSPGSLVGRALEINATNFITICLIWAVINWLICVLLEFSCKETKIE